MTTTRRWVGKHTSATGSPDTNIAGGKRNSASPVSRPRPSLSGRLFPVITKGSMKSAQATLVGPLDERVQAMDKFAIEQLSYCPTLSQVDALCDRGRATVTNDLYKQRAAVLVKKPGGTEPTSNVLGKSAFFGDGGLKPLFLGNGGDRGPFAFIRDHGKFPYNNRSMGLLGVMRTFHESVYGAHRVNLFQGRVSEVARRSLVDTIQEKDRNRVREMLVDFINFRDRHVLKLLSETVRHMSEEGKMMSSEHTAVRDIMQHCANALTFSHTGLGVVSFCQSWEVNDDDVVTDLPCFSVASPHFQTRFYVRDAQRLRLYLASIVKDYSMVEDMFENYLTVAVRLNRGMHNGGYRKSFVNLDTLTILLGEKSS